MRRRDFVTLIGGAAMGWPLPVRAQQQQPARIRRIGVLMNRASDDPEGQTGVAAFKQALQQFVRAGDPNLQFDVRWGADDIELERRYAAELVDLSPDIILASGTMSVGAMQNISRELAIVFVGVTDPAGAGFVDSLARPGGNTTGFII